MVYVCDRCHSEFQNKTKYINHLLRKRPCMSMYSNESSKTILEKLQQNYLDKPHVCPQCDARFAHMPNLYRHRQRQHKDVVDATSNMTNSNNGNQEVTHSHNTSNSHNMTNCPISVTNNISININPLGHEDLHHIENDHEFLTKCLRNVLADGIPNLLEKIYMDPCVPENHNIKLQRTKPPGVMMVYTKSNDGETSNWVNMDLHSTLDTMIEKGSNILIKHNNQVFRITKDNDSFDMRTTNISNVRRKKKGVYGKIRNGVLCKVKNDVNASNVSPNPHD